ncbi:Acyl-CoA dehydrogenase [compost metagenome]
MGDHFVLNGGKQFISNGSEAGLGLVLAVTDKAAGKKGCSLLIVDPAQGPGYVVARVEEKMGQRSAHVAQIQLEDCRVPLANLLGGEGEGYRNVMGSLSEGRVAIAAVATGTARAALEAAVGYAKEREAYGAPIINLQGVAFDLADMAAKVDVAHQFLVNAARLCEAGIPCAKEAAIAKLFASEMAEKVCSDALQIHGGYGYLNDFPVERYCRDVRVTKIYEGTSHIQKLIIARSL